VRGTKQDAQRAAAGLVSEADHGRITLTKETFGGLLTRWLDHIETRGRAPRTLVENRRIASAITEELGSKDLQKLKGSDLDAFYDRLRRRGLSATSVRRHHAAWMQPCPHSRRTATHRVRSDGSVGWLRASVLTCVSICGQLAERFRACSDGAQSLGVGRSPNARSTL